MPEAPEALTGVSLLRRALPGVEEFIVAWRKDNFDTILWWGSGDSVPAVLFQVSIFSVDPQTLAMAALKIQRSGSNIPNILQPS